MSARLHTSRQGLDLIRTFEGFTPASVRLSDGRWMIGYGHVRSAREGVRITEADAEDLLRFDLKPVEEAISALVFAPLTQNQFDALASFVFNISPGQFRESEILRRLNAGDVMSAAAGFDAWRKARINGRVIVVDALVRRRAAEKALFLEPAEGWPSASTPIVTPELDALYAAAPMRPSQGAETSSAPVTALAPASGAGSGARLGAGPGAGPGEGEDVGAITAALDRFARARPAEPPSQTLHPPDAVRPLEPPAASIAAAAGTKSRDASPGPVGTAGGSDRRDASRVAAARIARILERVEAGADASSRPRSAPSPAPETRTPPASRILAPRPIPEDLPDFDAPAPERQDAARARTFIDDTDIYEPPPRALDTAQAPRRTPGTSDASLAFIALSLLGAALCAAGFVALTPEAAADNAAAPLFARPVIAAGALMLVAGVYCLVIRRDRPATGGGPRRER